jgi:hypothetical protein
MVEAGVTAIAHLTAPFNRLSTVIAGVWSIGYSNYPITLLNYVTCRQIFRCEEAEHCVINLFSCTIGVFALISRFLWRCSGHGSAQCFWRRNT